MDGGHIIRVTAVHPVHPQTPVTRTEESLSIIHLTLQVTFNYIALYICHAPIYDWQLSVLHNGNLYGCASTLLYEFHTMGLRNITIWPSHLYLYWQFPYINMFQFVSILGKFQHENLEHVSFWVLCVGYSQLGFWVDDGDTERVLIHTQQLRNAITWNLSGKKTPNNRAQSVIEISGKGSYQYIWQKLRAIESKKGKI